MKRIRLLIADDHPIVRQGVRGILSGRTDIEVAGEVASGDEVIAQCERLQPDVLLLDVSMPGPGFFELLRSIVGRPAAPAVLVFSMHAETTYAARALEAGARGYLSKPSSAQLLPEAIRAVARGETFCSECARQGAGGSRHCAGPPMLHARLSSREFQVFVMLGGGMRVAEIAAKLGLSPKTVSTHRARILEKTELPDNAAIVRYVGATGLLD